MCLDVVCVEVYVSFETAGLFRAHAFRKLLEILNTFAKRLLLKSDFAKRPVLKQVWQSTILLKKRIWL